MTESQRKKHLRYLVSESVGLLKSMLTEQDLGMPGAPVSAVPPSTPPPPAVSAAPQAGAGDAAPQGEKPFTVDEMIERLNVVRSGKSFSDPEVYGALTTFFRGLSDADKAVVDRFLQGLGKVVIQVGDEQQGQSGAMSAPPPPSSIPTPPAGGGAPSPAAPSGPMG